jgi:hypothetical protein
MADERYPWRYPVTDAHGRPQVVAIGAENGHVVVDAPPWWKADPDTGDLLSLAFQAANDRAGEQRRGWGQ